MKDVDKTLGDRIHAIEREQTYYRVIGAIAIAVVIALSINWMKDTFASAPKAIRGPAAITTAPELGARSEIVIGGRLIAGDGVRISKIRISNFANFSEFEIETGDTSWWLERTRSPRAT